MAAQMAATMVVVKAAHSAAPMDSIRAVCSVAMKAAMKAELSAVSWGNKMAGAMADASAMMMDSMTAAERVARRVVLTVGSSVDLMVCEMAGSTGMQRADDSVASKDETRVECLVVMKVIEWVGMTAVMMDAMMVEH